MGSSRSAVGSVYKFVRRRDHRRYGSFVFAASVPLPKPVSRVPVLKFPMIPSLTVDFSGVFLYNNHGNRSKQNKKGE